MQRILIIKIIINLFFILDCLGLLELDKDEWHPNTDIRNLDLQGDIFYHELQYHYYQVTEGLNQRSNIRNPTNEQLRNFYENVIEGIRNVYDNGRNGIDYGIITYYTSRCALPEQLAIFRSNMHGLDMWLGVVIRNPRTNYRQDRHFDIAVTWLANTIVDYQIQNDNTLDIFYANEAYVYDFEGGACYPDN